MPVQVQGPDGNTYQFPDGTDKNAAISYFKKKGIGAAVKPPAPKKEEPGLLSRVWQVANTPINEFSQQGRNETKKLEELQAPPRTRAQAAEMGAHPIKTAIKSYLAGVEERASDLATPLAIATVLFGAAPEAAAGRLAPVAKAAKAALPVAFGAQGAQQEYQAATDENLSSDERMRLALGGGAALAGAGAHVAGRLAPVSGESIRKGVQGLVGAGEKPVKAIVAKEAASAGEAAKSAIKANREAAAQHATKTSDVKEANKEAVRAQSKIAPTQEKLKTAGRELQAQIETARNNALKVGNEKYNTVHAELNPLPADNSVVATGLGDAISKISGSQVQPPILKAIENSLQHEMSYEDLQGYYSELGRELSKGTLPGDLYQAYDTMQEAIGSDMQRIADSKGLGGQLLDARNYWRRMKQAFGKPYNPTDAGNAVLEKATGQGAAEEQANRVRLLGAFDPSIPQTVEHIGNLRQGLEALPDQKPLRDVVKPLPAKPEPKFVRSPEVNTRTIRENLLDRWTSGETQLGKFQVSRLVSGGLGAVVGGLFEGRLGAGAGGVIGSTLGPAAIARFVEMPAVREWLTRPPAEELETLRRLPAADRLRITDTLSKVVDQAGKFSKPIKISPKVNALIVGTQGLAPRRHPTDEWSDPDAQR